MTNKGTCPNCKKRYAVTKDGTIRRHGSGLCWSQHQYPLDTVVSDVVNGLDPNERILQAKGGDVWEQTWGDGQRMLWSAVADLRNPKVPDKVLMTGSTPEWLRMLAPNLLLETLPEGAKLRLLWRDGVR